MGNFATDKLGAGTIFWTATERPIVAPDGTLYWDVTDENFYIRKFSTWVPLTAGGVGSINGLMGSITLAGGTGISIVPTGNTLTFNSTGTIGGTIATGQVAFGTGANTIGGVGPSVFGSPSFFWDNTNDFLTIVSSGSDSVGRSALSVQNASTPTGNQSEMGILSLVSGNLTTSTSGNFYGIEGETNIGGSFTVSGFIAAVTGQAFVISSLTAGVVADFLALPVQVQSAATATKGVGFYSQAQAGSSTLNAAFYNEDQGSTAGNWAHFSAGGKNFFGGPQGSIFGGPITFNGSTSGSATIGVAAVASTPNQINLPTATGAAGTFLQTNGANPQQTSWVAAGSVIASGTATMPTGALPANTSSAAVTVAGAGILATDAIEWAFNAAPGTGYTEGVFIAAYVTSGNVNFIQTNPTAGSRTPAAATLNWRVIR